MLIPPTGEADTSVAIVISEIAKSSATIFNLLSLSLFKITVYEKMKLPCMIIMCWGQRDCFYYYCQQSYYYKLQSY